jgi:hypothetical protein
MAYLIMIAITVICLEAYPLPEIKDTFLASWAVLMWAAMLAYSFKIGKKYSWFAGVLLAYVCLGAVEIIEFPVSMYDKYTLLNKVVQIAKTSQGLIAVLCSLIVIDSLKHTDLKKFKPFFVGILITGSIYTIYQWVTGEPFHKRAGYFLNISLNGGILATLYPVLLDYKPKLRYALAYVLPVVAIFCVESSVAVGVLALSVSAYYFMKIKSNKKILVPILVFSSMFTVGYFTDKGFFSSSNRFKAYEIQYSEFVKDEHAVKGVGHAGYTMWGISNQLKHRFMATKEKGGEIMVFLHNDWLQMLIEYGYIGALLVLLFTFELIIKAWGNPLHFSMLISYMGFMLFHYPTHYPVHAFVGLWIIASITLKNKRRADTIKLMEVR